MLSLTPNHITFGPDRASVRTSFRKNDQLAVFKKIMSFRRTDEVTCPVMLLQLSLERLNVTGTDWIFYKLRKKFDHLQSESLQHNLRRMLQKVKFPLLYSAMDLRRAAVTVYIANGLSFEVISSMLGWRGSDSVMYYNILGRLRMADYSRMLNEDYYI